MRLQTTLPPFPGWGEIPPDDLPLNGAVPRDPPAVRQAIVSYVHRQPVLRDWIARRRAEYARSAFMWRPDAIAYAAARDAACWQLRRPATRICEMLAHCC